MKSWVTKKNISVFSGSVTLITFLATEELRFCYFIGLQECPIPLNDSGESLLFPFLFVFFFSLLTYPMKDEVFAVWWRFTRWFVPVIIIISFLLNGGGGGGLGISGAVSGAFNFLVICIFYLIFILVSLIKIIREYKRTKI